MDDTTLEPILDRIAAALEARLVRRESNIIETWRREHSEVPYALISNMIPELAKATLWDRLEVRLDAPIQWSGGRNETPALEMSETPDGPRVFVSEGVGACAIDGVPVLIDISRTHEGRKLFVVASLDQREIVTEVISAAISEARTTYNRLRGSQLLASFIRGEVVPRYSPIPEVVRDQVAVDESIWEQIDNHVHAFLRALPIYSSELLGGSRGVLISGPPGVGKSMAARVLATEVTGSVTVIWCEADVMRYGLASLYQIAADLAPSLVILDDVDLVLGERGPGRSDALANFLTSFDRMADADGVVTIATTNAPAELDRAAVRSARIGHHLTIPLPEVRHRREILAEAIRAFIEADPGIEVELTEWNLDELAARTEGATAADLKERVVAAVIAHRRLDLETLSRPTDPEMAVLPFPTGTYL